MNKTIRYCWFGDKPLPQNAKKCIASWKKFFPDYEIKLWNEDNYNVNINTFSAQAYKMKKYAFVSDVARFWILYNYGGIYFDTDVEVIRDMRENIIVQGPFLASAKDISIDIEKGVECEPGLGMFADKGMELFKEILDIYNSIRDFCIDASFMQSVMIPNIMDRVLLPKGYNKKSLEIQKIAGFNIYPPEYFAPITFSSGRESITLNTYSIHYYNKSWLSPKLRIIHFIKMNVVKMFGERFCFWLLHLVKDRK